ncbi:MAG: NRDE family protein [Desulfofustis sp. PB-SRB1]|jgi:hypothetical protein|nr:NRDE family protein [Desulfofustis sp. PB-SRB1]MBM1001805.1 NRDE family protein [Desulfofustis sp. PB-SRB1]HBH28330.1 hypothetical protein [Desulfofustis sp.]HBH30548.1 hypothetical protein [Desulfofustis sp.]
MCTLTWYSGDHSYGVLFSRDESNARSEAEPPSIHDDGATSFVSPRDPDGGGTWLWGNSQGVIACVLNHYPVDGETPQKPESRGLLLLALTSCTHVEQVAAALVRHDLSKYRPFLLFCRDNRLFRLFCWNMNRLEIVRESEINPPITTSGYRTQEVAAYRKGLYDTLIGAAVPINAEPLMRYHCRHDPAMAAHSVLTSRPHTRTRSISMVSVDSELVTFSYTTVHDSLMLEPPVTVQLSRD